MHLKFSHVLCYTVGSFDQPKWQLQLIQVANQAPLQYSTETESSVFPSSPVCLTWAIFCTFSQILIVFRPRSSPVWIVIYNYQSLSVLLIYFLIYTYYTSLSTHLIYIMDKEDYRYIDIGLHSKHVWRIWIQEDTEQPPGAATLIGPKLQDLLSNTETL